jgi:hypothetical protein
MFPDETEEVSGRRWGLENREETERTRVGDLPKRVMDVRDDEVDEDLPREGGGGGRARQRMFARRRYLMAAVTSDRRWFLVKEGALG